MPTAYPKRVRLAEASEEDDVMGLCRGLHAENGLFALDEDKVHATLRRAFNREGGILGVIGERSQLQAMIYMQIGQAIWYSKDVVLEELFAYVRPEYRRSRNAIELLQFSKWCAENIHFPLFIGIVSNRQTEQKVKLYQRQFSTPAGNFFLYNYPPAKQPEQRVA